LPQHSYSEDCGDVPADALTDLFTSYFTKQSAAQQKEIVDELNRIRFSQVSERF
jgi:hypothetical protein